MGLFFSTISIWGQEAPAFILDGNPGEWPVEWIQQSSESHATYAVYKGDKGLHILLTSADDSWQKLMLMTGLTLQLAPKGPKNALRQVTFPAGLSPALRPNDPNELTRFLGQLRRNRDTLLASMDYFLFIGPSVLNPKGQDTLWSELPSIIGIEVASKFDETTDTWTGEWFLPYSLWPKDAQWDKPMKIAWETGKLGRPIQLRGNDTGMQLDPINDPNGGRVERMWYERLDLYRTFAARVKIKGKIR